MKKPKLLLYSALILFIAGLSVSQIGYEISASPIHWVLKTDIILSPNSLETVEFEVAPNTVVFISVTLEAYCVKVAVLDRENYKMFCIGQPYELVAEKYISGRGNLTFTSETTDYYCLLDNRGMCYEKYVNLSIGYTAPHCLEVKYILVTAGWATMLAGLLLALLYILKY